MTAGDLMDILSVKLSSLGLSKPLHDEQIVTPIRDDSQDTDQKGQETERDSFDKVMLNWLELNCFSPHQTSSRDSTSAEDEREDNGPVLVPVAGEECSDGEMTRVKKALKLATIPTTKLMEVLTHLILDVRG